MSTVVVRASKARLALSLVAALAIAAAATFITLGHPVRVPLMYRAIAAAAAVASSALLVFGSCKAIKGRVYLTIDENGMTADGVGRLGWNDVESVEIALMPGNRFLCARLRPGVPQPSRSRISRLTGLPKEIVPILPLAAVSRGDERAALQILEDRYGPIPSTKIPL